MGARSGQNYKESIYQVQPALWHRGELVGDLSKSSVFSAVIESVAEMYDFHLEHPETQLTKDEGSGDLINRSFEIATDRMDFDACCLSLERSAKFCNGMLSREPSYLNRAISAFAGAKELFGANDPQLGTNIQNYHKLVRSKDLALSHTIQNPRINKNKLSSREDGEAIALHIHKERDDGVILRGARLLATFPTAEEMAVFPAKLPGITDKQSKYAIGAIIPTGSAGLNLVCRETFNQGASSFDHPLASRFEEMDAFVIFDDVFVPWERIFCFRDTDICNTALHKSGAVSHMAHQSLCRVVAKSEFLLGLASLLVDGGGLEAFQHIQEKISDIWVHLEVLRALKLSSEAGARANEFGVFTPAWDPLDAARLLNPKVYPRLVEIIQQIGASGLIAMPTQADVEGDLSEEIAMYMQGARLQARERIQINRLAWDLTMSAFGSRQTMYERYFFGDPVQLSGINYARIDRSEYVDRVKSFLAT